MALSSAREATACSARQQRTSARQADAAAPTTADWWQESTPSEGFASQMSHVNPPNKGPSAEILQALQPKLQLGSRAKTKITGIEPLRAGTAPSELRKPKTRQHVMTFNEPEAAAEAAEGMDDDGADDSVQTMANIDFGEANHF